MISPLRAGSGLYCTTPNTPSAKLFRQLSGDGQNIPTILEVDENQETDEDQELVRSSDPKINIGSRFQAEVPDARPRKYANRDRHPADLVWHVPPATNSNKNASNLMENFMELSCSAAVPYGGSNREYAIDCLARAKGNILAAVRQLICNKSTTPSHCESTREFLGSGSSWTHQEVKHYEAEMLDHRKDFFVISKAVKTRSTAECVERYYHVTKRQRRRIQRPKRFHGDDGSSVLSLLAGTPSDVRKAMKIESSPTSSSSDEEVSNKNDLYMPPGQSSWSGQQHPVDSYPQQTGPPRVTNSLPMQQPNVQPAIPKPLRTHKGRVQHSGIGSPSPAGSPASTTSADDQPTQIFTCPVCGKSFGKVKSRNAHMKTHGKQAQEKRRQREEEAARRREESTRQLQVPHVNIPRANFIVPSVPGNQLLHNVIRSPHSNVHISM
uniref:ZF(C2H2)-117 zinc finger protein n=1 Tax=Phallusia mammillata TaxID=59560 RepID=A0A6F9DYC7_9ASCI|nr:ZF(C2H2)-117 zinc finger protein [Phallusia mammillata]